MNKRRLMTLILAATLGAMVADALACGESRFRTSHGLRFQGYQAPLPASVLVFAEPRDRLAIELDVRRLSGAGHQVVMVSDGETLAQELDRRPYDVLITSDRGLATAEYRVGQSRAQPEIVPLVEQDEAEVRARYPNTLDLHAGVRRLLGTLDDVMKVRSQLVGADWGVR